MPKKAVVLRVGVAAALWSALGAGVFFFHALPLPHPPPYGGAAHPWLATLGTAGILAAAVLLPSAWGRAAAWSASAALSAFEGYFALSRLSAVNDASLPLAFQPWPRAVWLAAALGAVVFLLFAAVLLSARKAAVAGDVVSGDMRRRAANFRRPLSPW